jgi:predicted methyltransferase
MTTSGLFPLIERRRALVACSLLCLALLARTASADTEIEQIVQALELRPGQVVADVGAGDGEWSERLSPIVGADGRVLATEIEARAVERLSERFKKDALRNAEAVLGYQRRTGLATASCDAILLRLVYHHLTDPNAVAADLYRALRPAGRLAIIDFLPQHDLRRLPGVPDRGGHGVRAEDVIAEMEQAGFRAVARHDSWGGDSQRFCVVFEHRPATPAAATTPE